MYIFGPFFSSIKQIPTVKRPLLRATFYSRATACKMRLQYVPNPPNFTSEDDKQIVERIKERRGERGLIGLDRSLLHAPPVADGW